VRGLGWHDTPGTAEPTESGKRNLVEIWLCSSWLTTAQWVVLWLCPSPTTSGLVELVALQGE